MAQGVVDGFEVVQVHKEKRYRLFMAARRGHGLHHELRAQAAVWQARQRVVLGQVGEVFLRGLVALDDIPQFAQRHLYIPRDKPDQNTRSGQYQDAVGKTIEISIDKNCGAPALQCGQTYAPDSQDQ